MIRLGFIGVGFVAQQCHLPSFESIQDCKIAAISDLQSDLLIKIGNRYEVENIYSSHDLLLKNKDIDAVVITVPRKLTADLCIQSIRAGKKVFVEKPIALNENTGFNLIKESIKYNIPVQVGYMRRWDSAVIELINILEHLNNSRNLPILIKAFSYAGDSYANPFESYKSKIKKFEAITKNDNFPDWLPNDKTVAYENYLNIFSHTLDLLNFLFKGNIKLISSVLDNFGQGITLFETNQGIPMELSTARSSLSQWMEGISIVYSDRVIDLQLGAAFLKNIPGIISIREGMKEDSLTTYRPEWSWAFRNQAINFVNICKNWPNANTNLISSVEQISLIENIFKKFHVK
jgi:predicted dehydrogenase